MNWIVLLTAAVWSGAALSTVLLAPRVARNFLHGRATGAIAWPRVLLPLYFLAPLSLSLSLALIAGGWSASNPIGFGVFVAALWSITDMWNWRSGGRSEIYSTMGRVLRRAWQW